MEKGNESGRLQGRGGCRVRGWGGEEGGSGGGIRWNIILFGETDFGKIHHVWSLSTLLLLVLYWIFQYCYFLVPSFYTQTKICVSVCLSIPFCLFTCLPCNNTQKSLYLSFCLFTYLPCNNKQKSLYLSGYLSFYLPCNTFAYAILTDYEYILCMTPWADLRFFSFLRYVNYELQMLGRPG